MNQLLEGLDWKNGTPVQRCNMPSGKAPAYRFRGVVCGKYTNRLTGEAGYVVSLDHDPGCIQIFPAYMLEVAQTLDEA